MGGAQLSRDMDRTSEPQRPRRRKWGGVLGGRGVGGGAQALTLPVVSMPLMTHRYTTAQEAARQSSSRHWTGPLSLMSAETFRVRRYQK